MPSRKSSEAKQDSRSSISSRSCSSVSGRVARQRVDRLLVALHRERGVGGDLGRQLERGGLEPRRRRRPRGRGRSARRARPRRLRPVRNSSLVRGHADRVDEAPQAGVAVDQPELRRRHAELGARGAEPQVAVSASSRPPPSAWPLSAAITGQGWPATASSAAWKGWATSASASRSKLSAGIAGDVVAGREGLALAGEERRSAISMPRSSARHRLGDAVEQLVVERVAACRAG